MNVKVCVGRSAALERIRKLPEGNTNNGKTRGPRTYKSMPTPRERVITGSLAAKVKELTGREVSAETCRAVKWTLSRWYEDPATKTLLSDMDAQLKKAKAQEKLDKLEAALREAKEELNDVESDDDSGDDDDDGSTYEASLDDTDEDEDDIFASDSKVSASF